MDAKDHIGSPIYLAPIRMGRDEAEETVETGHGGEGGGGLLCGKSTGRSEDASVNTATVVQQVAYCYLQLFGLGGGGWGGRVRSSGGLGGAGTIGGGGVNYVTTLLTQ